VFTGYLRGEALAHAYAAADVFAFPAANETLGNVVLEAMASGLPVVAPRSGGLLDHVTHGRNGLLFEAMDEAEWVQAVTRLVQYPELARSLGAHGRVHAETRRWETVLDGLLDEYTLILNRRAKRHARGLKRPLPAPAP
jgi:glycosyltransferase involved in cell wall biosynthesis